MKADPEVKSAGFEVSSDRYAQLPFHGVGSRKVHVQVIYILYSSAMYGDDVQMCSCAPKKTTLKKKVSSGVWSAIYLLTGNKKQAR